MVFPTTIWTTIHHAAALDRGALDDFAQRYRSPVLQFIRRRGFDATDAEDICQDVFVRVFQGCVLAKADRQRGRFRSLLLTVAKRVIQDRLRRRRPDRPSEVQVAEQEPDFDRAWVVHLTERALEQLRQQGSPYYRVVADHLGGRPQDRNKLWIARGKLAALIRREVAFTCATPEEYQDELRYLAQYLQPPKENLRRPRPAREEPPEQPAGAPSP